MKKKKVLSILLLATLLLLCTCSLKAQNKKPAYIIKGNTLQKVEVKGPEPVKTEWTINIKDTVYPVWKSVRGSYYILKTSKKTGREYKQYLEIINLLEEVKNDSIKS